MNNLSSVEIQHGLFELLSPIFYISRLICFQPLEWKKQDSKIVIKKSNFYVIYSCVTSIFIVTFGIYGLYQAFQIDVIHALKLKSNAVSCVSLTDVTVVIFTFGVGVMITLWKVDKYLVYLQHLSQFDHLLGNCLVKTHMYSLTTYLTVFPVLLLLVYDWISWIQIGSKSENVNSYILGFYLIPYHVAYFAIIVIELIYWHFVYCIKIRFVAINKKLRELRNEKNTNHFVRNHLSLVCSVVETAHAGKGKGPNKRDVVRRLIEGYESLVDATKLVNDCYGFIILIIIFGCLVHLLVTPFAIRAIFLGEYRFTMLIVQSFWILFHILRLLLVIEPCHRCMLESKETTFLVCKLLLSDVDGDIKNLMELFLSLLSQDKIEFTAFGLASVDRSLIPAITGAVTTYIVILFQFN